ncbi:MAG: DegV family EDD domain-containing protein [Ruminococcus sp.]|nr:DegV family EDD domain-containing protein [Ruminococcus sp.]
MSSAKIKELFYRGGRNLRERLFILITSLTAAAWLITIIGKVIAGVSAGSVIGIVTAAVLVLLIMIESVRSANIKHGAIFVSVIVSLAFPLHSFLRGGGINGDAPIWFLFGVFFINVCLTGEMRVLFLVLECAEAVFCWYFSWKMPALIYEETEISDEFVSFAALFLASAVLCVMTEVSNRFYLSEVKRSINQKKEIEALSEAQNHFFSSMSHEIRTPINTIIALNEMILRENISDEVAEDAVNIQSASNMLLHLINDILDMSKFASGQMKLSPVSYNPGDMLSDIVGMLWIRAKEKNLDFQVNVSPELPVELIGDEIRIKQILINVLNNAIKYTHEGEVSLSIQPGEEENGILNVIYTVSDTGIGIKKENIPYLFTAFRRVDEEKNRHIEGTGLGLSIVKQFVDLMGGRITVNSIYTKGSTFIIEIPQKVSGKQNIGEIKLDSLSGVGKRREHIAGFEAPEAKVLVVDDNAANLLVVSKLLRITKVQTDTVASGEEALRRTLNIHYHVIFMDHLMPNMDGIECLNAIRSQIGGHCRDSKIVALTANAGSECKTLYEKAGFDGYLTKPITGDILERELYRLLPRELTFTKAEAEDILKETVSWMNKGERKKTVVITTESVADLPQEIIDRYGIAILPHLVCTEEGNFMDGVEIETKGMLDYMQDISRKVVTRSPDIQTVESFFAKQLTSANNIIHISISSGLANSGCPAAQEAARAFNNVTVIDSGHLSSGQGLMVIEACRLVEEGKSPEEITEHLESLKYRIHTSFVVDSLDFLARAEQVTEGTAAVTKALMAKPVLVMRHSKLGVGKIYFGSRDRVWRRYIRSVLRRPSAIDRRILFVTYVGLSKRDMEWIREQVEKYAEFDTIYFQKASPVIAMNCGEGTFGLLVRDADVLNVTDR